MPVPKRKVSRARRNKRSANKGIKPAIVVSCQTCQAAVLPHQVCRDCGYYKGVKVLRTKSERAHERAQTRQTRKAEGEAPVVKPTETPPAAGE